MAASAAAFVLAAAVLAAFAVGVAVVVMALKIGVDFEFALQEGGDHVGHLARSAADFPPGGCSSFEKIVPRPYIMA